MTSKDFKEFLPLTILGFVQIISWVFVIFTNFKFVNYFIVSLPILVILYILFFVRRDLFKVVYGIVLLISTFGLFEFSIIDAKFQVSFLPPIRLFSFVFLIWYILLYKRKLLELLWSFNTTSLEDDRQKYLKKVDSFRRKFRELSDYELEKKKDQELVDEARQALNLVLKERFEKN